MPDWFWYSVVDGCWNCKDENRCTNCSVVKKYRKDMFEKKEKGKGYGEKKNNKIELQRQMTEE